MKESGRLYEITLFLAFVLLVSGCAATPPSAGKDILCLYDSGADKIVLEDWDELTLSVEDLRRGRSLNKLTEYEYYDPSTRTNMIKTRFGFRVKSPK